MRRRPSYYGVNVTVKEVKQLLAEPGGRELSEFSDSMFRVVELADGRVLWTYRDQIYLDLDRRARFPLYHSRARFEELWQATQAESTVDPLPVPASAHEPPECRHFSTVSWEEVEGWLASSKAWTEQELTAFLTGCLPGIWQMMPSHVFELVDGRLVLAPDGPPERGGMVAVYHSRQNLREWLRESLERPPAQETRGRHILCGAFPDGREFIAQIDAWVGRLVQLLHVSPATLDFSLASLKKLDRAIRKRGDDCVFDFFEGPLFPSLTAYGGEMIRRAYAGRWTVRESQQEPEVWEPYVEASDRLLNPWSALYDEFDEQERPSVYAVFGASLPPNAPRV